jgi:hypothetical protein
MVSGCIKKQHEKEQEVQKETAVKKQRILWVINQLLQELLK